MGFRGKNKFFAHKVEYDGMVFDSRLEKDRYLFLVDAERRGEITDLPQCLFTRTLILRMRYAMNSQSRTLLPNYLTLVNSAE
jgi:hypothetical protein